MIPSSEKPKTPVFYVLEPAGWSWKLTIQVQRRELLRLIKQSPSLKPLVSDVLDEVWRDARDDADWQ
jgi:hypothetical protein